MISKLKISKFSPPRVDTPNILMLLFLIATYIKWLCPIPGRIANICIAVTGAITFLYVFVKKHTDKNLWKVIIFGFFMSICMTVTHFYNYNADLKAVLWIWCYLGVMMLICYFNIDSKWYMLFFYLCAAYFFVHMVMLTNINTILYNTSRNGIPSLLMFPLCLYFLCKRADEGLPYLPVVLFVTFSVWTLGRAGVLCALFLLLAVVGYNFFVHKKGNMISLVGNGIILCILLVGLVTIWPTNNLNVTSQEENASDLLYDQSVDILNGSIDNSETHEEQPDNNVIADTMGNSDETDFEPLTFIRKFTTQKFRTTRTVLYKEYFNQIIGTPLELLFGATYSKGELLSQYKNPHNTFLELHSKFGIMGFLAVMFLLLFAFIQKCKEKNGLWIIIFFTVCIRTFFDWMAFPGLYDVLFWYFIFGDTLAARTGNEKV